MPEDYDHDYSRDRRSFDAYQQAKQDSEEMLDSPVDRFAENIAEEAEKCQQGRVSTAMQSFREIISALVRTGRLAHAISGLVSEYVEEQCRVITIQTTGAVLSLIKTPNPHLTIDLIEHAFGLSKDKEADIGRRHGESRQVINKAIIKIRRQFGIETEHQKEITSIYSQNKLQHYEKIRSKLQSIKNATRPTISPSAECFNNEQVA